MIEELKPCPFCGEQAVIEPCLEEFYVVCKLCGAETKLARKKEYAIGVWNTRVDVPDINVGNKWFKYPEEKPKDREEVLVYDPSYGGGTLPDIFVAWHDEQHGLFYGRPALDENGDETNDGEDLYLGADVTHWQPLPKPPKGERENDET